MSKTKILWSLALVGVLAFVAAPALLAQDEDAEKAAAEEMEAYMKLAAPGEHHEHLTMQVGTWNTHVKFWTAPGADAQESEGHAISESILGGRFIMQKYKGNMMGMPFEGVAINGYDNIKGKYVGLWMDSFGTMMLASEGTCDGSGKVTTMFGEYPDPSGDVTKKSKTVMTVVSDDEMLFEMYDVTTEGKEFKNMEMTYTRTTDTVKKAGS